MNDQEIFNQAMLERQEALETALILAEGGSASESDWNLIWWECGFYERRKQLKGVENVNS